MEARAKLGLAQEGPVVLYSAPDLSDRRKVGAVLNEAGQAIPGLFAAGRSAIGIPSNNYVSGLSLADCTWSGRRAARAIASRAGAKP